MYSSKNNPTTKKIYELIDSIQDKLYQKKKIRKTMNQTSYQNINPFSSNENVFILRNQQPNLTTDNIRYINIIPSQSESIGQNALNKVSNDIDIRKIIKEEFDKLILSYQFDMNSKIDDLNNKINSVSNDCYSMKNEQNILNNKFSNIMTNNNEINKYNLDKENSFKEIKQSLLGFVSKNEFDIKNEEIFEKINLNKNNNNFCSKTVNEISNKLNDETNNINQKIQELNLNFEDLKSKFNNFSVNYNNEIKIMKQNNDKILTNEIRINEIDTKYTLIQKKLDEYYQELYNFKNNINSSITSINEKNNELNNKLNNKLNIEREKNLSINNFKDFNENLNNYMNNMNKEIIQIKEKVNKIDLINIEQLSKFDFNNINLLYKECQDIKANYPKLFEYFEKYDIAIKDLNTKLNKLNTDFENEMKKRYNQINDKISKLEEGSLVEMKNPFNNKSDIDSMNKSIEDLVKRIKNNEDEILDLKNTSNKIKESVQNLIKSVEEQNTFVMQNKNNDAANQNNNDNNNNIIINNNVNNNNNNNINNLNINNDSHNINNDVNNSNNDIINEINIQKSNTVDLIMSDNNIAKINKDSENNINEDKDDDSRFDENDKLEEDKKVEKKIVNISEKDKIINNKKKEPKGNLPVHKDKNKIKSGEDHEEDNYEFVDGEDKNENSEIREPRGALPVPKKKNEDDRDEDKGFDDCEVEYI